MLYRRLATASGLALIAMASGASRPPVCLAGSEERPTSPPSSDTQDASGEHLVTEHPEAAVSSPANLPEASPAPAPVPPPPVTPDQSARPVPAMNHPAPSSNAARQPSSSAAPQAADSAATPSPAPPSPSQPPAAVSVGPTPPAPSKSAAPSRDSDDKTAATAPAPPPPQAPADWRHNRAYLQSVDDVRRVDKHKDVRATLRGKPDDVRDIRDEVRKGAVQDLRKQQGLELRKRP